MQCPKAAVFDLDETLAPSFQPPAPSTVEKLARLLDRIPVAIVTGAGFERIERDFLPTIDHSRFIDRFYIIANGGTQAFTWQGEWTQEYNYALTVEERSHIRAVISTASIELSEIRDARVYGDQISDREAQIAFTVVGLDAPIDYKRSWDPDVRKRRAIRNYLAPLLPEFDIHTGGASTIDITRKDINKAHGVKWLSERLRCVPSEMVYVGDALFEGGNDAVVIPTGIQTCAVSGPLETERILEELIAGCAA